MRTSSRTPDGRPIRCPVCGAKSTVLVSTPPGDSVCPACGSHIWVQRDIRPGQRWPQGQARNTSRPPSCHRREIVVDHLAVREPTFPIRLLRAFLQRLREPSPVQRLILWWTGQRDRKEDGWIAQACGIIDSMTEHEKSCPESIDGSRIRRIAAGSGTLRRNVCEFLDWLVDLERDL
jgi:hypothetical protein